MSLRDLTQIEIYSASKKSQSLNKTASAVFVLTNEDIRRSGVAFPTCSDSFAGRAF